MNASSHRILIAGVGIDDMTEYIEKQLQLEYENLNGIDIFLTSIEGKKNVSVVYLDVRRFLKARRNARFGHAVKNAGLVIPSHPLIKWAAKILYKTSLPVPTDGAIFQEILLASDRKKYSLFLFGGTNKQLATVKKNVNKFFKDITIAGVYPKKIASNFEPKLIEGIRKISPDILMTFGAFPKDYYWFEERKDEIRAHCFIGAERPLLTYAGKIKPPPRIFETLKLAKLYGVLRHPLRAFLTCFACMRFITLILFERVFRKKRYPALKKKPKERL